MTAAEAEQVAADALLRGLSRSEQGREALAALPAVHRENLYGLAAANRERVARGAIVETH
ncbi:hypothetical protein [Micromonospora sp. DT227]|uniref:hypothetical protein n=1 Tax=Micromonospora sp. DT227 TaxID=3393433 RepID=UPI003CF190B7